MTERILSLIMVILFVFSFAVVASAAEVEPESETVSPRASSTNASFTVTDTPGNKFYILGYCYTTSSTAASYTGFSTSHYVDGTESAKEALDAQYKTLGAGGTVAMINGLNGASTTYSGSERKNGGSAYTVQQSDALLYTVTNIYGTHSFSFNGGSKSGSSTYSLV